jgi:hypothetical protein
MDRIKALVESEDFQTFISEAGDVVSDIASEVYGFSKVLKAFALNHPEEFLDETIEDTVKNLRVFSEIATAQYITELCSINGSMIAAEIMNSETHSAGDSSSLDDYL